MRKYYYLFFVIISLSCNSSSKEPVNNVSGEKNQQPFFEGTIKLKGEIVTPLFNKKFETQYNFSRTKFKFEYIEGQNSSGLIINYKTSEVTLYANDYNTKRKYVTDINNFIESHDSLDFFKGCIDRVYSQIDIPKFQKRIVDFGAIQKTNFDILKYKGERVKISIFDLKINIPDYVTRATFIRVPKEVQYFPLLQEYDKKIDFIDKIQMKPSKIMITSIEFLELSSDQKFTLLDDYKLVKKINFSISEELPKTNRLNKSIFEKFDD